MLGDFGSTKWTAPSITPVVQTGSPFSSSLVVLSRNQEPLMPGTHKRDRLSHSDRLGGRFVVIKTSYTSVDWPSWGWLRANLRGMSLIVGNVSKYRVSSETADRRNRWRLGKRPQNRILLGNTPHDRADFFIVNGRERWLKGLVQDPELTGLSILVVEDDVLLRKQIASQLERLAADVTIAGDLASARKLAGDLSFDFVLLDVNLPDGRGTVLLKEKVFASHTGTIVMTADGGVETAVEAMRLGGLDYLVKPFDPAELPLVIARVRRARQSARLDEHRRSDTRRSGSDFFFGPSLAKLEAQLQKVIAADERMQTH